MLHSSELADTTMINDYVLKLEDFHLVTLLSPHITLKVLCRDRAKLGSFSHKASDSSQSVWFPLGSLQFVIGLDLWDVYYCDLLEAKQM